MVASRGGFGLRWWPRQRVGRATPMKCLTAPHATLVSRRTSLFALSGSLAALLFIALTPLLLAYHDVPGLSTLYFRIVHAGPQPHSPLSLLYKDLHHNHPLLAQKAFVIALRMGGTHTTPCSPSRRPLSLPKKKTARRALHPPPTILSG